MKNKTLLYLFIIALILGFFTFYWDSPSRLAKNKKNKEDELALNIKTNEIKSWEINKTNGEKISLVKTGDQWLIGGNEKMLVDKNLISSAMAQITTLPNGEIVSTNSKNFSSYGVLETETTTVDLKNEKEEILKTIYFGNQGPTVNNGYYRFKDQNEVHLINSELFTLINQPLNDWLEKNLLLIDQTQIKNIAIKTKSKPEIILEKINEEWQATSPEKFIVNKEIINELLTTVSNFNFEQLRAESSDKITGLTPPENQLIIVMNDKTQHVINFGLEKDGFTDIMIQGKENVYQISSVIAKKLLPTIIELKKTL